MPIRGNELAKFKLRITRLPYGRMIIGIVDYARQKDEESSSTTINATCYFSLGYKYPE